MNWTSNKPTKPGWYWLMESHRTHLDPVIVLFNPSTHHGVFFTNGRRESVSLIHGSFAGPLEPPEGGTR